jgi:hypothetical protein
MSTRPLNIIKQVGIYQLFFINQKKQNGTNHNTTAGSRLENGTNFQIIKAAIPSIYRKKNENQFKKTDRSVGAISKNLKNIRCSRITR